MSYLKPILAVFFMLTASQANAMWKLIKMVEEAERLANLKEVSWDERLLEARDLDGFLAEAQKRGVNPNASMSSSKETALTLACKLDMTGEKVKMLLERGGISMNTWETEDAIWSPLYFAVQAGNEKAAELFLHCESVPLTNRDMEYLLYRANK